MDHHQFKQKQQLRRRRHVRRRLFGTNDRPRLTVHRSLKHIYAQLIDDAEGKTLGSTSTVAKEIRAEVQRGGNRDAATAIGKKIAEIAKEKGITKVAFDRGHYKYHGRIKALADAAREAGLQF